MSTLTQCELKEVAGTGIITSWIPSHAAHVGTSMTIEDFVGRYEVTRVFDTMNESYVKERGRDYRNTRKASDV